MAIILLFLLLGWQEENPRARAMSIYPHPKPPEHIVHFALNAKVELVKKHWLWNTREPYQGKVQIQQARPKGGWWISATRMTDVNGELKETIDIDSTWPQHLLLVLLDERTQIGSCELDLGKQNVCQLEIR